jgi:hypothetical protein
MLENMEYYRKQAENVLAEVCKNLAAARQTDETRTQTAHLALQIKELRMMSQVCAKDAAPYIHSKPAQRMEHEGEVTHHLLYEDAKV